MDDEAIAVDSGGDGIFAALFVVFALPTSISLVLSVVLAVIGVVAALFGWIPSLATAVGWLMVGVGGFVTTFSGMLDLPNWIIQLSVFAHLAE